MFDIPGTMFVTQKYMPSVNGHNARTVNKIYNCKNDTKLNRQTKEVMICLKRVIADPEIVLFLY